MAIASTVKAPPQTKAALAAVGRSGLWWLTEQCAKRGWSVDGAFALIHEESLWNPRAKVPANLGTASGLIQATDSTAKSLGFLSAEAYRLASPMNQLRAAVKYWDRCAARSPYSGPSSFFLWGLGGAGGEVLYPAGSLAAKVNPHLQDSSGALTRTKAISYFAPHVARVAALPRCPKPVAWLKLAGLAATAAAVAGTVWSWYGSPHAGRE